MKVDTSSIEITEQTEKTEQTESDESFIKLRSSQSQWFSCQPPDRPARPGRSPRPGKYTSLYPRRPARSGLMPQSRIQLLWDVSPRRYSHHPCGHSEPVGGQGKRHLPLSERIPRDFE